MPVALLWSLSVSAADIPADKQLTGSVVTAIAAERTGRIGKAKPFTVHSGHKRYIVELNSPPVAVYREKKQQEVSLARDSSRRAAVRSAEQHRRTVAQEQDAVVSAIQQVFPTAAVDKRFDMVFNGVVIEGTALDAEQLTTLPNVKRVYEDRLVYVNTDNSLAVTGASAAWSLLNGQDLAGAGIKIAVIDSGIRPENPMFDDAGISTPATSGLPADDYCRTHEPSFCNDKVIVARTYPAPPDKAVAEYLTPLAYNSHGTHVAGIIAGRRVVATLDNGNSAELSGVAPGAYLMVYKALYATTDGRAAGYSSSLLAAINDAVKDGAHIINNSWGGLAGEDPDFSPYKAVYQAVEEAGVLLVSAAGNDGESGAGTIGCPGCIEAGITVANTNNLDRVHPTSSRGPNGDNRFIKPDLAAPGTSILSAASPDENSSTAPFAFKAMTGTSMAAPHVAGAAALISAAHPSWTPAQIKAALTTTSHPDVQNTDGTAANAFATGAGRLDISQAINAGLAVSPVSVAGHYCLNRCQFSLSAGHLAKEAVTWAGSLTFDKSSGVTGILSIDGTNTDAMSLNSTATQRYFSVVVDTAYAQKEQWHFGEVVWQDTGGKYPDARIPVAVYAGNSSNKNQLTSSGAVIMPGQYAQLTTQWDNIVSASGLQIYIPDGVTVEGQPVATITDSTLHGSSVARYNPEAGVIRWSGALNSWFTPADRWALPSLAHNTALTPVGCHSSNACDEGMFTLQVEDKGITYLGMSVKNITFHSNGYLTFNSKPINGQVFLNDELPTSRASGAVLAPFWTDLDIAAAGDWYAASREISGKRYYILEWNNAYHATDSSNNRYTFQVILAQGGTEETYINYIDIGPLPERLTVGVQDFSGKGSSFYYNGTGIEPASGSAYRIEKSAGSQVELTYLVSSRQLKTMQLHQDTTAVVDLTDRSSARYIIKSELQAGSQTTTAYSLFEVVPETIGQVQSVSITRQPDNGAVTTDKNGMATYTPAAGFSGRDLFGYTLTDTAGKTTSEAIVGITVIAAAQPDEPPVPPSSSAGSGAGNTESSGGVFSYWLLLWLPLLLVRRSCL